MSSHLPDQPHDDFHLPEPSAQPVIVSLGVSLLLGGLVPDELLWKLTLMSVGATIAAIGLWIWISDAIDEYRKLPD